jgi:hypothetical protein
VTHEVTNVGHDRNQLANMAKPGKTAMGASELNVVADRGYFNSEEILKCYEDGISTFVSNPITLAAQADGRFGKTDFIYGTLKAWMCSTHFLTKTIKHVNTEINLHVLAYNLKRVMKISETTHLVEAMMA